MTHGLGLAVTIGGAVTLGWGAYGLGFVGPEVEPLEVESTPAVSLAFTLKNNDYLALRDTRAICKTGAMAFGKLTGDNADLTKPMKRLGPGQVGGPCTDLAGVDDWTNEGTRVGDVKSVGTIQPRERKRLLCNITFENQISRAQVAVGVMYDLQLFPGVFWGRTRCVEFEVIRDEKTRELFLTPSAG